jgi:hypothetical protein
MVVSLWFSFEDFPKLFPNEGFMGFILNKCTTMMILVQVFSQWGFWVYILMCNPRWYPEHWDPILA